MDADDRLDLLLRSLADPTRRALLDRLRDEPGLTLTGLLAGFLQTRQALSKHLAMLEDAELVVPLWRGREKHHYLNPAPLQALPARWVTASARQERAAMGALRDALATAPADGGPRAALPAGAAPAGDPVRADDAVAARLLAPPSSRLQGQPVMQLDALDDARAYLAATAAAVGAMSAALAGLPPEIAYRKPGDGGFSIVVHLWHLADIEALGWCARFERILAEVRPRLPGVDGDRLAIEKAYQEQPWRGAARRFVGQRRRSLVALARFDAEVLRRSVHFAGARARAGAVVAAAVAHDLEHRLALAACWRDATGGVPSSRPSRKEQK